jgi:hypothetical protein
MCKIISVFQLQPFFGDRTTFIDYSKKRTIMKIIYNMRFVATSLLLLVMLTFTKNTWAQPVVTVPPSCNVVVPGTGGTPGFGGDVGGGGIVIMPDLISAAGMFNINPMGNTILGWSLAGDLSFGPISQPTPAVQSAPGSLNEFITSYNKDVRIPSETTPPSADFLARSKGRVTISYTNPGATCGGGIYFDVFKEYVNNGWPSAPGSTQEGYVPEIIGPDCWEPNTAYTYSVDQIASDNYSDGIGGDEYYWSISPTLGTFYTSADKSSITFTTPFVVSGTYTIECCFGRSNPWDGNVTPPTSASGTCVTKTIGQVPGPPAFITWPPTCEPVSSTSFFVGIAPVPGYTYAWTSSNSSWFLAPSGTQNQDVTVSSLGSDPGILTLTITNGSCDPSIFTYPVNREFDGTMSIVAAATCVPGGSTTNFAISTGAQNQTCWNLPGGWTYTPVTGSESSINVTVPPLTPAGAYTVSAYSCTCPSTVLNVTVNVQPDIPVISGPSCVVPSGGPPVSYTASGSTGLSYNWLYPTGWNCIIGCVTTTATFIPGGTLPPPLNMYVVSVGTNGCDATSAPFTIDYGPVTPSGITANCWNFGVPGTTNITVANAPSPFYGSYTISSTPSGLITGSSVNPSTGVITVNTSGTAPAGSYTINVIHTTGTACGNSPVASFPITYNGNGTVLTTIYNPGAGGPDVYITSSAPAGSTYNWYLNGGGPSVGTGPVLYLTGSGPAPTSVCVYVTNGGCTTVLCASPPGTHNLTPGTSNPEESTNSSSKFELFPNPNDGNFSVKVPEFKNEAIITIIDEGGREIGNHKLKEGINRISERDMPTGQYFLILNLDGVYSMHKLQVSQK